ncbi:prepilin-type N-terminal cleavage/methylation domain-containing protein [Ruminococcus sp.]|uniref:type II secretion system protein n=1 Tax=Ruminococcus sp. TaxID=41978 RepID=UPI0025FA7584|nr:prepilin-type N-terminal cleavage/methylation domain-containing protein [Ruminococcus sp.]MBQ9541029.1 prepilin-type N-terminal cleavage/methylation domain-containing protein [Ruminococcus sp.]
MKNNKKGMTLVECIIAMAVFAVATTGFTMAATACIKAQVKSHSRNRITNAQTTNLEHFSNYSKVLDPSELNVEEMPERYAISFNFEGTANVINKDIYGYTAIADPDDKVYQLSFISPIERVTVMPGEWWITIYNGDPANQIFNLTLSPGFEFFDNEKERADFPAEGCIWGGDGGIRKIGIRSTGGSFNDPCMTISCGGVSKSINILGENFWTEKNSDDSAGYASIYYNGAFVNKDEYEGS